VIIVVPRYPDDNRWFKGVTGRLMARSRRILGTFGPAAGKWVALEW
jgi:hypothetical protein